MAHSKKKKNSLTNNKGKLLTVRKQNAWLPAKKVSVVGYVLGMVKSGRVGDRNLMIWVV